MSLGNIKTGKGGTLVPSGDAHLGGTDRKVGDHSDAEAIGLGVEMRNTLSVLGDGSRAQKPVVLA